MNLKELKEIINLMKEHGLSELEIEKEGFKIKLKKSNGQYIAHEEGIALPKASIQQPALERSQAPAASQPQAPLGNEVIVRSPMVGTFYPAPAPDQAPYVNVGTMIKPDDVLCIVEAMKLMNEIKSEISGRIIEIMVENGTPVEFDQPLFRVALP